MDTMANAGKDTYAGRFELDSSDASGAADSPTGRRAQTFATKLTKANKMSTTSQVTGRGKPEETSTKPSAAHVACVSLPPGGWPDGGSGKEGGGGID